MRSRVWRRAKSLSRQYEGEPCGFWMICANRTLERLRAYLNRCCVERLCSRCGIQLNLRIAYRVAETIQSEKADVPRAAAVILGRSIVAVFAVILEEYGVGRLQEERAAAPSGDFE